MPKTYDPQATEPELIKKWIQAGCYGRSKGTEDRTVVIPPPNVTGILHMGHAMGDTIQDTYIRYSRMRGYSTRWILGTDHAGIATQTKVDKKLKSEGVSRLEIGREKFIEACWDWTREYGGIIVEQIKRMGCSVDFDDEKFTMSPEYTRAVRKVFVDWYHHDLIYRGKRIVNWCPHCETSISDDEAEYADEKGHLWYLRYPLKEPVNGIEYITAATTRPETMLGDTGVAVSPQDPEKADLVGAMVVLPIVNREIPIFSDWHVDAGYGTGFVKVTPAHDPNDFAMGEAHGLEKINIFDEHAVVSSRALIAIRHAMPLWRGLKSMAFSTTSKTLSTPSCTAIAAAQRLSHGSPSSGLLPLISLKSLLHRRFAKETSPSIPSAGRRPISRGWITFVIGTFPGSFGGGIVFRSFTATIVAGKTPLWRIPMSVPSAAAIMYTKTRTSWIPGSPRSSGLLPHRAGLSIPSGLRVIIPQRYW